MKNSTAEKKDAILTVLDVISAIALGGTIAKVVFWLLSKGTTRGTRLMFTAMGMAVSYKLTEAIATAFGDEIEDFNESIIDYIGDLVNTFKTIRTQRNAD